MGIIIMWLGYLVGLVFLLIQFVFGLGGNTAATIDMGIVSALIDLIKSIVSILFAGFGIA